MEASIASSGSWETAQPSETLRLASPEQHSSTDIPNLDDSDRTVGPEPQTSSHGGHAHGAKSWAWRLPILMSSFFIIGAIISLVHCSVYWRLNGQTVGDMANQEWNLRLGAALVFIAQIALVATVRVSFIQWFWLDMKDAQASPPCLNPFSADSSMFTLLNCKMVIKYKVSSAIAVLGFLLILPSFYTPATLSIYLSTNRVDDQELVPSLIIADGKYGNKFSFSPPARRDEANFVDDGKLTFNGPRSSLSLISSATSSLGEILPIAPPHNHSAYSLHFYGPLVRCDAADSVQEDLITKKIEEKMRTPLLTAMPKTNVYYAFVPAFDSSGALLAQSKPRLQSPSNATNELWVTFSRYALDTNGSRVLERLYQRCALHNASYDLRLEWVGGAQSIDGSYRMLEEVLFPHDTGDTLSNKTQHSYSAVFWALADQLVGQLTWFSETDTWKNDLSPEFGLIDSQIRQTSLLGSSDLDLFFDLNKNNSWYGHEKIEAPELHERPKLSAQRQQDKDLAKNRTLAVLIEELSFNTTVSLLHNVLLTRNVTTEVTRWDQVNCYRYNAPGLFIPYALANGFKVFVVLLTALSYRKHGVMPDKEADGIARMIAERSRKGFVTLGGGHTRRYSEA